MFKSIIIAFSTYSKIPVPRVEWNKKSMKYSLCFFPLVGAVTGVIGYLLLYAMEFLKFRNILKAALLAVLPVVINGGIHMDGFLDTVDAKSSYKPMEEKLKILKDPNTGAFAVIYGIVYMIAVFGLFSEIEKSEYIFIADKKIAIENIDEFNNYKYILSGENRGNTIKLSEILNEYNIELEAVLRCRTYRAKNKCYKRRNRNSVCFKRSCKKSIRQ